MLVLKLQEPLLKLLLLLLEMLPLFLRGKGRWHGDASQPGGCRCCYRSGGRRRGIRPGRHHRRSWPKQTRTHRRYRRRRCRNVASCDRSRVGGGKVQRVLSGRDNIFRRQGVRGSLLMLLLLLLKMLVLQMLKLLLLMHVLVVLELLKLLKQQLLLLLLLLLLQERPVTLSRRRCRRRSSCCHSLRIRPLQRRRLRSSLTRCCHGHCCCRCRRV